MNFSTRHITYSFKILDHFRSLQKYHCVHGVHQVSFSKMSSVGANEFLIANEHENRATAVKYFGKRRPKLELDGTMINWDRIGDGKHVLFHKKIFVYKYNNESFLFHL